MTKKTIFIVDDNKSNLVMASEALNKSFKVMTFDSGLRLLNTLEKLMPDLILLDVEMPEMDGYAVIKILKSDSRFEHIPIIFLTALNSAETELKGLSLGAVDYISKPFSVPLLQKRINLHLQLLDYNHNLETMINDKIRQVTSLKNAVLKITAEIVEQRDENTGKHVERTQMYMDIMINAMKEYAVYKEEVSKYDIELVLQSSQMHDVGKIAVRDAVLLKPGKLDPDEFEDIKLHTSYGEKIIQRMKENTDEHDFLEYARILAISHHEKWDGSGYPHGLFGEEIPLLGRIMAVCDVYDALVSARPYKEAFSHETAMEIIGDGREKHFDPKLVDVLDIVHLKFKEVSENVR